MNDRMLTAAEVAEFLGVDRDSVYRSERLRALGRAIDLGSGKRPRLRWLQSEILAAFPPSEAGRNPEAEISAAGTGSSSSSPATARTRRRALPDDELISLDRPIRGRRT